MAVTLPITSEALLQWYQSTSRLLISGDNGRIEQHAVGVIGIGVAQHALKRAQSYSICGPFFYEPDTDTTIIKYSNNTQTEVLMKGRTPSARETFPIVSGLGKVLSIVFAEGKNEAQPWNMILTAQHDYYDSLEHKFIYFSIDYHFGYHTPSPVDWERFSVAQSMWLHGLMVGKKTFPARYVVEVFDFVIVTPNDAL